MARKKIKSYKKKPHKLFVFLLIALCISFIIAIPYVKSKMPEQRIANSSSLQIDTFTPQQTDNPPSQNNPNVPTPTPTSSGGFVAPTPVPTSELGCGLATGLTQVGTDEQGKCCLMDGPAGSGDHCCEGVSVITDPQYFDQSSGASFWCNAKPVIYLYPKKETYVDVTVTVPGSIFVSIPQYPKGGWKNVLAYPNGKLLYQGKIYRELFYESVLTPVDPPVKGFVVNSKDLNTFLKDFTMKLGLNDFESNEFVNYWMPNLKELNSPYIFVSVFDKATKEKIDYVAINPRPDTFIEMILYFKPLKTKINVQPLETITTPKRTGFTAIEWGGILDAYNETLSTVER